jgi:DNA polymerase III delta subunit
MIILLYGPDAYRRNARREVLRREFEKKYSAFGMAAFDFGEEGEYDRFTEFLESQSMFAAKKLALVEHPFEDPPRELAEVFRFSMENPGLVLLLVSDAKPPKQFSFLAGPKSAELLPEEFEYLSGAEWEKFIRTEAARRELVLASAALKLLAAAYLKDTWGLVTELDKLALLDDRKVEASRLEALTLELAPDFWAMVGGLKNPSVGVRLRTLERLLAQNEPAAKIFNLMAYQWPERQHLFAAYDLAVKSGKCEYEEVLMDLALS